MPQRREIDSQGVLGTHSQEKNILPTIQKMAKQKTSGEKFT